MRPFFVSTKRVTWLQLKSLYVIEWSPRGGNRHAEEEDTIFLWEKFLQNCEREWSKNIWLSQEIYGYKLVYNMKHAMFSSCYVQFS